MEKGDHSVNGLFYVTAKELNINSCNGANPDTYNIAYGFMQRTNITGTITGFDGGAKWDPNKEDHVRGDGDQIYGLKAFAIGEWYYVQEYQSTWWRYVEKNKLGPIREREGRRYLR